MFLDASAVIAILKGEPRFEALMAAALGSRTPLLYSPLSRFAAIVSLARNSAGAHRSATAALIETATEHVEALYAELGAVNFDLTEAIGTGALNAAKTYGRAVGHPAGLNLGDCFAYACAKAAGVGLLYKGENFGRTDLG
jgi:ribonuclease VapC